MKKKLFLFSRKSLILFIVLFSVNMQNGEAQGTCATATNIASLPYSAPGLTNCGKGATYSGTPACLDPTFFDGEDYVFKYTPAANICINAKATFGGTTPWNSGMAILDKCPSAAGANCVGVKTGDLTATNLTIGNVSLVAGKTYYFVISGGQSLFSSPPNECMDFDFKVSQCPIPPPPPPNTPQGIECGTNLGFENGNLSLWKGYTDVNTQTPTIVGLIPGAASVNGSLGTCGSNPAAGVGARQTRTTGAGTDPNTDNVVTVVAPGCRTSSVRIGNDECGYQSEALEQTFLVTNNNVLFTYLYAVVMQDPGHIAANEPKFEITMKDKNSTIITCGGVYSITSDNATADGFINATAPACGSNDVWYKNWTAVGTDLTPYIGQNLTIRFTTSDCTQGGHFGYAYVDTYCKPKEILGTKVCTTTGSITLTAPAGFSNYIWHIGTSAGATAGTGQTKIVSPIVDGAIYTVEFKSIVGTSCTSYVTDTVKLITAIAIGDTTICGGAVGTKKLTASSSDATATYSWSSSPAGFTSTLQNPTVTLPAVTTVYKVIVTSPLGCSLSKSVTITVGPCVMNATATSVTICNGTCGNISATGSSGTPPFTYAWTGGIPAGAGPHSVCPTVTTNYTVTVTDNAGLTATALSTVTVNPKPVATASTNTPCAGSALDLTSTGGTTWSWTGPGGFTSALQNPTITPSTVAKNGVYTVIVSSLGCTGSATVNVIVNPNPIITVPPATICSGNSTTLTASGATTYTWTPAATLSAGTGTSVTASPTVTTTYSITGTDVNGCTGTTTVVVTVTPACGVGVSAIGSKVCSGICGTVSATATSGIPPYIYSWSNGATTSSQNLCPAVTTTYTLTVSDNSVPITTATATAVITVDPPITLNIAGFPPKCFNGTDGQAVVIPGGGDGIYTYQWAPIAGTSPSITGSAGTYSVTVTDLFGCTAVTSTVIINPTPIIGTTTVITANCNKSDGSATVATVSGGTPGYIYSWNTTPSQNTQTASNIPTGNYIVTITDVNGCTTTIAAFVPNAGGVTASATKTDVTCFGGNDGSATATQTGGTQPFTYLWNDGQNAAIATNLTAGTYTVIVTDVNGCSSLASVIITQPTQVVVTSTSARMCALTSATINATGSGGTGVISFAWNPGALTGPWVTVSPAITTIYTLIGTDANGCTGSTTATVTVNPIPVIAVPNATICFGTGTTLTAVGATTYTWAPTTGLSAGTGNPVIANPPSTTTYTVIGTDGNGCTGATMVVVTVNPLPVISVPPSSICPGDTTTLTASGALTYIWSPASGLSSNTGTSVIARPNTTTVYTITGTDANGCSSATTTSVTVHPNPVASIGASPNPASVLDPTISFTDNSTGAVTWKWNLGDKKPTISTKQNPSFTYPDSAGHYIVKLFITSKFGCVDSTWIDVYIKGEYTFFIPNTFTPNGDGTNDYFSPKGTGIDISDYDLWIFDRWGNLIWHTRTWGEAWDGRANDGVDIAQIDTYVWKVHVKELDNHAVHNYIGHVNIVK